eukprot:6182138-Pleurochrysis_carterae.AAC.1
MKTEVGQQVDGASLASEHMGLCDKRMILGTSVTMWRPAKYGRTLDGKKQDMERIPRDAKLDSRDRLIKGRDVVHLDRGLMMCVCAMDEQ